MLMKKAIVYYSYSGHTKRIVDMIKEKIDADVFEIKPKEPYSTDYDEVVDLGQEEVNRNYLREIEDININLNNYDTVILATPVWWYTFAPVVHTFLEKYDLKDKKVMPIITNGGWLGHTVEDIKKYAPNVINELILKFDGDKLVTDSSAIDKFIEEIDN